MLITSPLTSDEPSAPIAASTLSILYTLLHSGASRASRAGYLGLLVLGELVEDAVRELALRAVVTTSIEGADPRPAFLTLDGGVVVGGLAGEAVPILGQHHR